MPETECLNFQALDMTQGIDKVVPSARILHWRWNCSESHRNPQFGMNHDTKKAPRPAWSAAFKMNAFSEAVMHRARYSFDAGNIEFNGALNGREEYSKEIKEYRSLRLES